MKSFFYVIASAKWLLKYNGPSSCRLKACIHCWYCWPQIIVVTPWLQNSVSVRVSLKVHICRYTAKQTSHFSFHFQENQHVQSKMCLHVTRGLSSSQSAKKMWITSNFVPSRSKIQSAEELNYRVYIKKTDIATVVSSLDLHFWGLKSSTVPQYLSILVPEVTIFWWEDRVQCKQLMLSKCISKLTLCVQCKDTYICLLQQRNRLMKCYGVNTPLEC